MTVAPETPGSRKQIQVKHSSEGAVEPGQREAGFQKRHVKRRTVVGDKQLKTLQQIAEREQHGRLFIKIPDEILHHVKVAAVEVPQANQEWHHPGAPLDARRLRIEKDDRFPARHCSLCLHERHEPLKIRNRETIQPDFAMVVIVAVHLSNHQMAPQSRDFFDAPRMFGMSDLL